MADISKPQVKDTDVWARGSGEGDIIIPFEKINAGWSWANKPSYQYLNWFWNTMSKFIVHYNQNGIAEWDENSLYASSGFAKYNNDLFQSFSENKNEIPSAKSRLWSGMEYIDGLGDVEIDQSQLRDILVIENDAFYNYNLKNERVKLNNLSNVSVSTTTADLESIVHSTTTSPTSATAWGNTNVRDLLKENIYLEEVNNVKVTSPVHDNEILQFKKTDIVFDDNDPTSDTKDYRWVNSFFEGKINFYDIKNTPTIFNPVRGSKTEIGGLRIWAGVDDSGTYDALYVEDRTLYQVPSPLNLVVTTTKPNIELSWLGTIAATEYNIYRDGVYVDNTPQTRFVDIGVTDKNYHLYYVTSVNGSGHESYHSNYEIGIER